MTGTALTENLSIWLIISRLPWVSPDLRAPTSRVSRCSLSRLRIWSGCRCPNWATGMWKDAKLPGLKILEGVDPRIPKGWSVYPWQEENDPEIFWQDPDDKRWDDLDDDWLFTSLWTNLVTSLIVVVFHDRFIVLWLYNRFLYLSPWTRSGFWYTLWISASAWKPSLANLNPFGSIDQITRAS